MTTELPTNRLQLVEILHVDTVDSKEFFERIGANTSEKCDCQRQLEETLAACCQEFGGYVASNWQGDGGHAFFQEDSKRGSSVAAAEAFISKLTVLTHSTATLLGCSTSDAQRKFRIKAHFGQVFVTTDSKYDSGKPEHFDSFLKHERDLAPIPDQVFITEQLHEQLSGTDKKRFGEYTQKQTYGALTTSLYRLKSRSAKPDPKIMQPGLGAEKIAPKDWDYLLHRILAQKMNVVARNIITTGLIKAVTDGGTEQFNATTLMKLTLRALFNYLGSVHRNLQFRIALWAPVNRDGVTMLQKLAYYPTHPTRVTRTVDLDPKYQVARAFISKLPVVTPSVPEARLAKKWNDFDGAQAQAARGLNSAVQFPIYRTINEIGEFVDKEPLGVLSVDCDRPDFFLEEELDQWTDDFVAFLANLALSAQMSRIQRATFSDGSGATTVADLRKATR